MLMSSISSLGLFCLAWAWLAYDHYRPWVNFHSETLAFAGLALLAGGWLLNMAPSKAAVPRLALWVLAIALIPWLQYVLGIGLFAGDALLVSQYLVATSAAIWLGYSYEKEKAGKEYAMAAVFGVLWFAAIVSAAIGLLQWLTLQGPLVMYVVQTDAGDRAMGNLGQPNQLATLLLMGIASLAWTFENRRIGRAGLFVGVAFMSTVLVLTQSRAGILSAVVAAVFLMWKNNKEVRRIPARWILFWLVGFGALVLLLPSIHDFLLMSSNRSLSAGDSARITIWKQMLSAIAQSPWLGYGWNQTPTAHAAGSLAVPGTLTYTNAHNVILDLLAWNGVPIGVLLTGACGYWFVTRLQKVDRTTAVYAMACLLPIAVHSMVEYPFAYSYFLITAGLMAGAVEASHSGVKVLAFSRRWLSGVLVAFAALGSYMIHEYLLIEEDFRIVRFENLRIGQTAAEYQIPDVWMFSHMASMLKAARQQALPGMNKTDIENLRMASSRFSYGSLSLRYALVLGLNGDPAGAAKQMAVIRSMYGQFYYEAAVNVMRTLQNEKYPELAQVITP